MPLLDGLSSFAAGWGERLLAQAREPYRITSTRRSSALQARLYRRYLAGLHPYPVAPPGKSKHEQGLAWDMVASSAELARLGRIWESWGGKWGGRFHDPIHFEVSPMMHRTSRIATGTIRVSRVSEPGKARGC